MRTNNQINPSPEASEPRTGSASGIVYVLLVFFSQTAIINAPRFTEAFPGLSHAAVVFLTAAFWAVLASFWKGLRPKQALVIPLLILFLEPLIFLGLDMLSPGDRPRAYAPPLLKNPLMRGMAYGILVQGFASVVVALGLRIGEQSRLFHIRQAGRDQEEKEILYEMRTRNRQGDISFYRFTLLLKRGFCLVAVENNRSIGFIQIFRLEDDLFLHDLNLAESLLTPDREAQAEFVRRALIREALRRFARQGEKRVIALLPNENNTPSFLAEAFGEFPLNNGNGEALEQLIARLKNCLKHEIQDWETFTDICYYFQYAPPWKKPADSGTV